MKSQIKIKICEREYTLIADAQEEKLLRKAAYTLNEKIELKRKRLGIASTADLLAMTAFDILVESMGRAEEEAEAVAMLSGLNSLILSGLNTSGQENPEI
ncbi:cell division protein ZapA [Limibacter armeniacum]|uniref:cell division protein ZapA n=1 Tax=Limibacter armeniacum TaxID=466084 RepID=UPI002FE5DD1A